MTVVQQQGLAGKIAEVILEVSNVEKDGHNDFQNYDYTSAEALLAAIRKPLASRGVVVFPKLGEVVERGAVTPKGKQTTITTAHVTYVFVDTTTGEREECPWAGTGDDPSDKGLYKAYTGAIKTFLRQQFLLPMGDDPEGDTEADKRTADGATSNGRAAGDILADALLETSGTIELATKTQLTKLGKAKELLGVTRFDAYLAAQGVDKPEDLTKDAAESVLTWARGQAKQKVTA